MNLEVPCVLHRQSSQAVLCGLFQAAEGLPGEAETWLALGGALAKDGKIHEAREVVEKAALLDPAVRSDCRHDQYQSCVYLEILIIFRLACDSDCCLGDCCPGSGASTAWVVVGFTGNRAGFRGPGFPRGSGGNSTSETVNCHQLI